MTLIDQQNATDSLMRRAEIASAVALGFGEKKDVLGKELEKVAKHDPDRSRRENVITLSEINTADAVGGRQYPHLSRFKNRVAVHIKD